MKAKIFLIVVMYCCVINPMDAPVARTVEPFNSSLSLKLSGMNSPVGRVQQQLADIVLAKSLSINKTKLDSQTLGINAVACKRDGTLFVSAYNSLVEPTLKICYPDGRNHILCKSGDETSTSCAAFSFDGAVMLSSSGKNLYFWDTQSWKLRKTLALDTMNDVHALAFNKNGQKVIVGGSASKNNLTIITKKSGSTYVCQLPGHEEGVLSCVGFSPDGMRAISVCENRFKMWDVVQTSLIYEDNGKSWSNCKIEYDQHNGWFLTGCDDVLQWWFSYDLNSGKKLFIPLRGKTLPRIKAYDRSACGNYIFLGCAEISKIFVFNLRTKQHVHTITSSGTAVSTIACSPDGKFMVCAIKGPYESHLYLHQTMSDEDKNALQAVYGIAGDQLGLVQRLIDDVGMKKIATLQDTDHITFDRLPLLLRVLLQKYFVPKESMEEHDFTLLDRSAIVQTHEDDEWTIIEK